MKKLYTTLLIVLIGVSAFAQSEMKKADRFFQQRAYMDASEHYRLVTDKNQKVLQNMGDSYFYTNRMNNAVDTYRLLFMRHEGRVAPEYKFRFAHALRATGNHEEADEYMSDYLGKEVNFEAWEKEIDTIVPHTYSTQNVMQNAASSDFGITFLGDRAVFASTRNQDRPIYAWNRKPYLDLFIADINREGEMSNISPLNDNINTDTHESSASFSNDGQIMYFDRTNSERVKAPNRDVRVAHISIYRAQLVNGEWTNVEPLPFTSDQYSTEHPTLSADGTKLYFASDMPGSLGSFDIYEVDIHEDGSFGEPRNLGPNVNTPEREQFPFISDDGVLYFSSNGRLGFGNMDIYGSDLENGSFAPAQNLGSTINSPADDFAFVLRQGEERGLFASNRRGSDNLYTFTREEYKPAVVPLDVRETNPETGAQQLRDVANIHFELDDSTILPEAKVILDRVVNIMEEYPELKVEIGAHADARGTERYNMALSQRRATATLQYLVEQGISRDRLFAKGYGESMPLNDCTEETGCTEEEYARNRRSEFKILN